MLFLLLFAATAYLVKKMVEPGSVVRIVAFSVLSAATVSAVLRWLPRTTYAESIILILVALVAIGLLATMLYRDHQADGITSGKEEIALVAITALAWLTLCIAYRLTSPDLPSEFSTAFDIASGASGSTSSSLSSSSSSRRYADEEYEEVKTVVTRTIKAARSTFTPSFKGYKDADARLAESGCVPGYGRVCVVEQWYDGW